MRSKEVLWMGSEESYAHYLSVLEQIEKGMIARPMPDDDEEDDDEDEPRRYERIGKVAIVPVKGSLVSNGPEWFVEYGVTPYGFIRNALIEANNDPKVEHILLDVDSSGGSANGVFDIGQLVHRVTQLGKPVSTYTGGMMCSAAYLIGSSASEVACSVSAEVGSIGVIVTHMDYSGALEKDGIKPKVLRAGKYKALASPFEPLSKAAEAQLQGQIDKLYDLFVSHVALMRGRSPAVVKNDMAEGRVFIGDDAMQVGLVDKIALFDDFAGELVMKARKRCDERSTIKEVDMARKEILLSEEQVAAIAEGAEVAAVLEAEPVAPVEPEAPVEPVAEEPIIEEPVVAEPKAEEPKVDAVVEFLKAELKAREDEIVALKADKLDSERRLDALDATHAELKDLAAVSVNRMRIALGGSSMDMSAMPAETILAEHASVSKRFADVFPIGGKAAVEVGDEPKAAVTGARAVDKARRRATQL